MFFQKAVWRSVMPFAKHMQVFLHRFEDTSFAVADEEAMREFIVSMLEVL